MDIIQKVKQLIINECANHDREANNIKNYCCLEWTESLQCIYFLDEDSRCRYFEESILPLNKELELIYLAEKKAEINGYKLTKQQEKNIVEANKIKVKCIQCDKDFEASSNRQKYCPKCKKQIKKEQILKRIKNSND